MDDETCWSSRIQRATIYKARLGSALRLLRRTSRPPARALGRRRLRGRQHRQVLPARLLALLLEPLNEQVEVGVRTAPERGSPREAERRRAWRGDAKRDAGQKPRIVADAARGEDGLDRGLVERERDVWVEVERRLGRAPLQGSGLRIGRVLRSRDGSRCTGHRRCWGQKSLQSTCRARKRSLVDTPCQSAIAGAGSEPPTLRSADEGRDAL